MTDQTPSSGPSTPERYGSRPWWRQPGLIVLILVAFVLLVSALTADDESDEPTQRENECYRQSVEVAQIGGDQQAFYNECMR